VGRSVERANAMRRPRRWSLRLRGSPQSVVSGHALALRKVCRAGFAGRGTPSALSTERHSCGLFPDPRRSLGSIS